MCLLIDNVDTKVIPVFNLRIPVSLLGVDTNILNPRNTYTNKSEWDKKANDLANRFINNFHKYENNDLSSYLVEAGPRTIK